jgi:hypothetical protein
MSPLISELSSTPHPSSAFQGFTVATSIRGQHLVRQAGGDSSGYDLGPLRDLIAWRG